MSNLDKALAEISAMRAQMARASEFRGYGPATFALTGVVAALAAIAQRLWLPHPGTLPGLYLALWVAVAAISAGVIGFEMVNRSRLIHSDLAEEMIWTAVEQFMPAAAAGAAITAVLFLFAPETIWMAPGLWQITFGLGVCASVRFLPRALMLVGGWYLACGLVCLALARAGHAFTPWAMGVPFGVGQWLIAIILQRNGRVTHGEA